MKIYGFFTQKGLYKDTIIAYYMGMEQSINTNHGSAANSADKATLIDLAQAEYYRLLKEKWGVGGSTTIVLLTDGVRVEGSLQSLNTSIRPEVGWDFLERFLGDDEGPADLRDLLDLDHLQEQVAQEWDEVAYEAAEEIIGSDGYVLHSEFLSDAITSEYSDGHGGIKIPSRAADNAVEKLKTAWKEEVYEKIQNLLEEKGIQMDVDVWMEHANVDLSKSYDQAAEAWSKHIETEWK